MKGVVELKIVILADSLALPRGEDWGNVPYESTYPFLLDQSLRNNPSFSAAVVIEKGVRFRTIEMVLDDWHELVELRKADMVIIHVGIVDCAPRVFQPKEREFVQRYLPARFRNYLLSFIRKYRRQIINLRPNRTYVSEGVFTKQVKEIVKRAKKLRCNLVFINIISPPDYLEARSPGYRDNVFKFNKILQAQDDNKLVRLIDFNSLVQQNGGPQETTTDGMHPNKTGHQLLAKELMKHIGIVFNHAGEGQ